MSEQRKFPPPWSVEKMPGGLKVCDASGQSNAYVYSRTSRQKDSVLQIRLPSLPETKMRPSSQNGTQLFSELHVWSKHIAARLCTRRRHNYYFCTRPWIRTGRRLRNRDNGG
jgi:hypothetical protein